MNRGLHPELLTDLYELTMAQAYWDHGQFAPATFSLFARRLPEQRSYLVAAGLEDVLAYLEELRFSGEALAYLESTGIFSGGFLEYLGGLRFTGDVWAIPEGRICFADEPLLEVTAPVIEAQVVETYVINQINLQTTIASKAARCVDAAKGKALVDFSFRRTQGVDAGLKVARASYIAGFQATSNVMAGELYGIPISGTMAHSFVTAYEHEIDSFRAFAESFPERCILLIDTYDTMEGARNAVTVAKEMGARGEKLQGVRLDSGDMLELSRQVRRLLDDEGLDEVQIVASGGLDEYEIDDLLGQGAPIDAFGVGTKMGVSADAPYLDAAYKMVAYDGRPVLKLSTGKLSLPGPKQVFRQRDGDGAMQREVLARRDDSEDGEPLLQCVMRDGRRTEPASALDESRRRFAEEREQLPAKCRRVREKGEYPVELSHGLGALLEDTRKAAELRELGGS
jgi:nicotinate phosphoribosyltransferase